MDTIKAVSLKDKSLTTIFFFYYDNNNKKITNQDKKKGVKRLLMESASLVTSPLNTKYEFALFSTFYPANVPPEIPQFWPQPVQLPKYLD